MSDLQRSVLRGAIALGLSGLSAYRIADAKGAVQMLGLWGV